MKTEKIDTNGYTIAEALTALENMDLNGMRRSFERQLQDPHFADMPYEVRFGIMVKEEAEEQKHKRFERLLKHSRVNLRDNPNVESIVCSAARGIKRNVVDFIASGRWIDAERAQSIIFTGPTGVGKTYCMTAFALEFLKQGRKVLYLKMASFLTEISRAIEKKTFNLYATRFAKYDVVFIDDYAMVPLDETQSAALMELFDLRIGYGATVIGSQLEFSQWHDYIGSKLQADAIMDRIKHYSQLVALKGESMRKGKFEMI